MRRSILYVVLSALLPVAALAQMGDVVVPIATDSRIKTFIYNENDVFSLMTHYGYQANIEFGLEEAIETVSVGDRVAFQIIPSGRRLFIRSMEEDARTNMTVVTNLRAYQFDLKSTGSPKNSREELVYVVRFFYPGEENSDVRPVHAHQPPPLSPMRASPPHMPESAYGYGDAEGAAAYGQGAVGMPDRGPATQNFLYSVTGPEALAPVRTYDDGRSTYLAFRQHSGFTPQLFEVMRDGKERPLPYRVAGDMLVVDKVLARFTVRHGGSHVCVYNDTLVPMNVASH